MYREVSLEGTAMETARLPLVIRERDTEYQLFRLVLLRRLLQVHLLVFDIIVRMA